MPWLQHQFNWYFYYFLNVALLDFVQAWQKYYSCMSRSIEFCDAGHSFPGARRQFVKSPRWNQLTFSTLFRLAVVALYHSVKHRYIRENLITAGNFKQAGAGPSQCWFQPQYTSLAKYSGHTCLWSPALNASVLC